MRVLLVTLLFLSISISVFGQTNILVLQSDFGLKDGAVAAMKGVAMKVSKQIIIHDLTHDIPPYDIWAAAYRLDQSASFWPRGTVFVSVVDPGVGSSRKPVVMKSKSGHYFVTPDNGTLTLVAEHLGVESVRVIDEHLNRLPGSESSYTFHGRDLFAYTAARLCAGEISFEKVGPLLSDGPHMLKYQKPLEERGVIYGSIDILDVQYGNVWTNIPSALLEKAGVRTGDTLQVEITEGDSVRYKEVVLYGNTFSDVQKHEVIAYLNSLLNFSMAINQGDFARAKRIGSGPAWKIRVKRQE
jgi:S-adenosylmethionine hydrolase